ncbi:MAG: hypothetical protein JWN79_2317 [Gemmatimonadetes bacterium]|jgi:hypothetical protein|nr:hypothetical protein [Gemmatimonadota bacterium]
MRLPRNDSRACIRVLAVLLLLAVLAPGARGQDTTRTANAQPTPEGSIAVLTLVDGSTLQGRVLEVTPTTIRFVSAIGESTIARARIRSLRVVGAGQMHDGEVWPEDPSRTRLFFAPTGRTLRKGEAYFADAYIFFPSFQLGMSDAFTMGAGMSLFPGLSLDNQIFYLTPKLGVLAGPNLNISVGALVAGAGMVSDDSPFGIAYGVATYGGEDRNLTAGGGVLYSRARADNSALLMVGGTNRISRGVALVSENYFYTRGSGALLSGGMRFIGERLSVDLAFFVASSAAQYPFPYVAFIYKL